MRLSKSQRRPTTITSRLGRSFSNQRYYKRKKHGWRLYHCLLPFCLVVVLGTMWWRNLTTTVIASPAKPSWSRQVVQHSNTTTATATTTITLKDTSPWSNTNNNGKVKFLLGIMSYDKKIEWRRRANIRKTYLAFYRDFFPENNKFCALADLITMTREPAAPQDPRLDDCQVAYAFVIGGNPEGPTQLLDFNETVPLTIMQPPLNEERDIVYLNIQENGKYGKSPTWFRYGLWVMEKYPSLHFDYIAKTDTDAALYPERFFDMIQRHHLQPAPHNRLVYGGSPFDKQMCGYPQHDHCAQLQTPIYMGGAFYFLSTDLATYITGPNCPRSQLFFPHEDMTTGNYVWSHPDHGQIHLVKEPDGYRDIWRHSVKNPNRLVHFYTQYLQGLQEEGLISAPQILAWNASFHAS